MVSRAWTLLENRMKPLTWILAATALAVIAAVWVLLSEDIEQGSAETIPAPATSSGMAATDDKPTTTAQPTPTDEQPIEVIAAAVETPTEETRGAPASFRARLGGLIGRVVEESGEPVPDFAVSLVGGGLSTVPLALDLVTSGASLDFNPVLGSVVTDTEGRFRFAEIVPRVMGVLILDPGGPRAGVHVLERTPESGRENDLGDIVLPGSVTFVGRIVDERSSPLPGVRVRATDLPSIALGSGVADFRAGGGILVDSGDENFGFFTFQPPASLSRLERWLPIPTTYSGEDGRFELAGARPGIVTLVIDDGIHSTQVGQASPTGAAGALIDMGDMVMTDGYTLSGLVVDEQEKPVPGAEVMAGNTMMMGPVTILRPSILADESGHFEVPGLAPRSAHAVARADNNGRFTPSLGVTPGQEEVRIVLAGKRQLVLRVVDQAGEDVQGVRFFGRCLPDDDIDEMPDFVFQPRSLDSLVTLDETNRHVLAELDAGLWDVIVKAPGFGTSREFFDLNWESLEELVELERGQALPVQVLAKGSDEPLEYALVTIHTSSSSERPLSAVRTAVDGRALLSDLVPGTYHMEATYPGLAVATLEAEVPSEEELIIHLDVGGTIQGSVVDGGNPPAESLMVSLSNRGDRPMSEDIPRTTLTAPDGSFVFHDVPAGEVKLTARDRMELSTSNMMSWWEVFAMSPLAEEEVFVTAGQETEITLVVGNVYDDVATGTVHGQLFVNNHPAAGWKVRTWGTIRRSVSTGPDGRFNMGRLAAGSVTLLFSTGTGGSMMRNNVDTYSLELVEGDDQFVDMRISTGGIRGRVINDETGQPVAGAIVFTQDAGEKSNRWNGRRSMTTAAQDGTFSFEPIAEGDYVVGAEAEGLARASSEPIHVSSMRTSNGVVVRISSAISISGRIVLEGMDAEADWMWLTAEKEDGSQTSARPDKETMAFEFDDLSPGTWTISMLTNAGDDIEPVTLEVRESIDELVLVFRPAEPDPEAPAATGDDEGFVYEMK
jgi:hypothetical protein